jgi:phosphoribosylformimino-5-aminoimidazole carboxamide ribotide isomerase
VIIGTKAVNDFKWFSQMAETFKNKLILGLDAKGSKVATHGWVQDSGEDLLRFASKAAKLPIAAIIYTDIARDGMMVGPNLDRTRTLIEAIDMPVIASGGVTQVSDIKKLAEIGASAAIIGRSLYEGALKLADAIKAARGVDE